MSQVYKACIIYSTYCLCYSVRDLLSNVGDTFTKEEVIPFVLCNVTIIILIILISDKFVAIHKLTLVSATSLYRYTKLACNAWLAVIEPASFCCRTDRRTDGRYDDANSRSYTVRSSTIGKSEVKAAGKAKSPMIKRSQQSNAEY